MQESDDAQQHRQGDVLELTCNGMVSCLYSTVMSGHSADIATHALLRSASLQPNTRVSGLLCCAVLMQSSVWLGRTAL